jgi:hypothetical protein
MSIISQERRNSMAEESVLTKVVAVLSKPISPSLKGIVLAEEKDNIVIKSGASVFRVPREAIAKEERTTEGIELSLNKEAKIVRETLVEAASLGIITEGVFGSALGGVVARDCDCQCLCDCKCDCDCKCLCDDSQFARVMTQVEQLAKFGQLNINLTPRIGTPSRRI